MLSTTKIRGSESLVLSWIQLKRMRGSLFASQPLCFFPFLAIPFLGDARQIVDPSLEGLRNSESPEIGKRGRLGIAKTALG